MFEFLGRLLFLIVVSGYTSFIYVRLREKFKFLLQINYRKAEFDDIILYHTVTVGFTLVALFFTFIGICLTFGILHWLFFGV